MEYTRYISKAHDCVFLSSQEMSVLNRIIEQSSPTRTNNINTWTAEQTNFDPKLSNEHTHQMFLGCQQFGLLLCSCWSCLQGIFLEAHILWAVSLFFSGCSKKTRFDLCSKHQHCFTGHCSGSCCLICPNPAVKTGSLPPHWLQRKTMQTQLQEIKYLCMGFPAAWSHLGTFMPLPWLSHLQAPAWDFTHSSLGN